MFKTSEHFRLKTRSKIAAKSNTGSYFIIINHPKSDADIDLYVIVQYPLTMSAKWHIGRAQMQKGSFSWALLGAHIPNPCSHFETSPSHPSGHKFFKKLWQFGIMQEKHFTVTSFHTASSECIYFPSPFNFVAARRPLTLNNPCAPISIIPFDQKALESQTGKHHRCIFLLLYNECEYLIQGITPKNTGTSRSVWGVVWRGCFNVISKSNCQSITISLQPRL